MLKQEIDRPLFAPNTTRLSAAGLKMRLRWCLLGVTLVIALPSASAQQEQIKAANAADTDTSQAQNDPSVADAKSDKAGSDVGGDVGGVEDLLPVDEAFVPDVKVDSDRVLLSFKVAHGYYLYKERISLEAVRPDDVVLAALQLPTGEKKVDEFFGEQHVYHQNFSGIAPLSFPNGKPNLVAFKLKYQGCADAGVCYPPQFRTFAMDLPGETVSGLVDENSSRPVNNDPAQNPESLPPQNATTLTDNVDPLIAAPINADPLGIAAPNGSPTGLTVIAQDALPEDEAYKLEALATDRNTILLRVSAPSDYYVYQDKFSFASNADGMAITAKFPAARKIKDEHFGDVLAHFGVTEIPLELSRTNGAPQKIALSVGFQGCKENSVCYPVMQRVIQVDLPAAVQLSDAAVQLSDAATQSPNTNTATAIAIPNANDLPAPAAKIGLALALLLALGGGLILNLMPCVLPVLSLKVMGLVESGVSRQAARTQAIWYTVGVIASFLVLGILLLSLRSAGQALGWGFQLQNPWVVGLLAYLMLAMGLSLSGVVSFGNSLGNLGAKLADGSGAKGAFFTGVLAAVVASPCTAPMMGTAMGYAFTQSSAVALVVLFALGLGLALPFLLIGFVPALASKLPRPGAWMEVLKQWLAVPLYATAIWLLWILGNQTGVTGMALALLGSLLLTIGLWWWDRQRYSTADSTALSKAVAAVFVLAAFWPLAEAVQLRDTAKNLAAEATQNPLKMRFSEAKITELRAKNQAILVDMTADWCITCKVNEKRAINTYRVGQLMQETQTAYLVGDYTNADPAIDAYLKRFQAVGVPLYVVYPKQGAPFLLPQILSEQIVIEAIRKANL